jgi:RNA polymerase subunit RPABC4/transcription elongation factor Spt4
MNFFQNMQIHFHTYNTPHPRTRRHEVSSSLSHPIVSPVQVFPSTPSSSHREPSSMQPVSTSTRNEEYVAPNSNSLSSMVFSLIQNELNNMDSSSHNTSDVFFLTEIPLSYTSSSSLRQLSSGMNLSDVDRCTELIIMDYELIEHDAVCPICQTSFFERNIVRKINHCQHIFHTSCIDRWLSNHTTCPVCRSNILTNNMV